MSPVIKQKRNAIIEFIGPTGIGKSFILSSIPEQRRAGFWTLPELDELPVTHATDQGLWPALLSRRLELLKKQSRDPEQAEGLAAFFQRVIDIDLKCRALLPQGSLLEEGLFHNFSKVISALIPASHEAVKMLCDRRIIIHVHSENASRIVDQIVGRSSSGRDQNAMNWGLDSRQLHAMVSNNIVWYKKFADLLASAGCRVITIDRDRHREDDIQRMLETALSGQD